MLLLRHSHLTGSNSCCKSVGTCKGEYVRSFCDSKYVSVGRSRSIDRTMCHTVADATLFCSQCWLSCIRLCRCRSPVRLRPSPRSTCVWAVSTRPRLAVCSVAITYTYAVVVLTISLNGDWSALTTRAFYVRCSSVIPWN